MTHERFPVPGRLICLILLRLYLRLRTLGGWNLPTFSFDIVMHLPRPSRPSISASSWVHAHYIRHIHDVPSSLLNRYLWGFIVVSRFMSTLLNVFIHSFALLLASPSNIRIPLSSTAMLLSSANLPAASPHTTTHDDTLCSYFNVPCSYPHCPSCWRL